MDLDFGDLTLSINCRVKGLRRHRFTWRVSAPTDTTPTPLRAFTRRPGPTAKRKRDLTMDLQADKQVTLELEWTDEAGNATDAPADSTATFTVDNPGVINLTDNGDGTAVAAATGALGPASVHVDITADGRTFTGDLQLMVVSGHAERVTVLASEESEVTPDE